jgi:hypothetical protein
MENLFIFSCINIVISISSHFFIKSYILASIIASPVALTTIVLIDRIMLGYFDPLIIVTFILGLFYCFLYALIVGIPFLMVRKRIEKRCKRNDICKGAKSGVVD